MANNILIIEDEMALLESLTLLFDMSGFTVTTASNGSDAIAILDKEDHHPEVIICDVNLPDMPGHDILKHLRQHKTKSTTPFIFLSAFADKNDVQLGLNMGADEYVTKPFHIQDLLNTVNAMLAKRRADRK